MERRVLEASYALRDSLGAADDAIAATRKELDVDDILVRGDMAYVEVRAKQFVLLPRTLLERSMHNHIRRFSSQNILLWMEYRICAPNERV